MALLPNNHQVQESCVRTYTMYIISKIMFIGNYLVDYLTFDVILCNLFSLFLFSFVYFLFSFFLFFYHTRISNRGIRKLADSHCFQDLHYAKCSEHARSSVQFCTAFLDTNAHGNARVHAAQRAR